MAARPVVTTDMLHGWASERALREARAALDLMAAAALSWRGNVLTAHIEGESGSPITATVTVEPAGITAYACTCRTGNRAPCRHVLTALVLAAEHPDEIDDDDQLTTQVAALQIEQLRTLVLGLLESGGPVADAVARWLRANPAMGSAPGNGGDGRELPPPRIAPSGLLGAPLPVVGGSKAKGERPAGRHGR